MTPLRVVLDTNCLVSALIFSRGRLGQLRLAWQAQEFTPIVCKATVTELLRVFGYPKFSLTSEDIDSLLADFLPWVEVLEPPNVVEDIPALRDRDDAIFIHLALTGNAAYLVSGDRHLLELQDFFPQLQIIAPTEFLDHLYHKK